MALPAACCLPAQHGANRFSVGLLCGDVCNGRPGAIRWRRLRPVDDTLRPTRTLAPLPTVPAGKGGCLRTLVCQQCANRALQLDVPTGKRFVDAHGMARCLVCRETQVVASQLGPDRAYSINYNVMDLMDILGVQATCRCAGGGGPGAVQVGWRCGAVCTCPPRLLVGLPQRV